jgi:hypothetical protein
MGLVPVDANGLPTNKTTLYCIIHPIHHLALEVFTQMLHQDKTKISYIETHFEELFRMKISSSSFGLCIELIILKHFEEISNSIDQLKIPFLSNRKINYQIEDLSYDMKLTEPKDAKPINFNDDKYSDKSKLVVIVPYNAHLKPNDKNPIFDWAVFDLETRKLELHQCTTA